MGSIPTGLTKDFYMMGNCYKLFVNNRLYGIFATDIHAEIVGNLLEKQFSSEIVYRIELAYIENIGF